jgi:ribosomal protein S18 acetylase RimI-like enzyme
MVGDVNASAQISVRKFSIAEYENLMELWRESKLPHKPAGRDSKESITREIEQMNAVFLVAEKDGELVGSAFGTHDGRKGWINRVAVAPLYRRQGIAERLVSEVEQHLGDMGIRIIACLIEDWNKESMEFFEKIGYKRHHDIYYFTKRKDPEV